MFIRKFILKIRSQRISENFAQCQEIRNKHDYNQRKGVANFCFELSSLENDLNKPKTNI